QNRRIELIVPSTIPAGTHTVQVIHDLPLEAETGQPPVLHRGTESNVLPVLVLPTIQSIVPASVSAGQQLTVTVSPPVLPEQSRTLLLGDVELAGAPVAPGSPPTSTIDFTMPSGTNALTPGSHFVRTRVAGAESRLSVNLATGSYSGPSLTVTP
ncbi:MAG TPA: hypothetical protein VIV60_32675, partial [Polyangiaceae bacterium]